MRKPKQDLTTLNGDFVEIIGDIQVKAFEHANEVIYHYRFLTSDQLFGEYTSINDFATVFRKRAIPRRVNVRISTFSLRVEITKRPEIMAPLSFSSF